MTTPTRLEATPESRDYYAGVRRALHWLEATNLPPAIITPARQDGAAVTLFWNLAATDADDFHLAAAIMHAIGTERIVGWRKMAVQPNRTALMAVERTIPACLYINVRNTDEPRDTVARDFDLLGVEFL